MNKCILCENTYSGYGNNAEPLAHGVCCDGCNGKVIGYRMMLMRREMEQNKKYGCSRMRRKNDLKK